MSYIGSTPTSQNFISGTDYFNGTGSQTAFTLTRSVNSVNDVEVVVNNVIQQPSSYTVSGTTLTLSAAPSSGTSNVYVRYLATNQQSFTVGNNTVGYNQLTTDMQSKFAMKNRIINGAMVFDQRNAGASVSVTTNTSGYCLDRWKYYNGTGDGDFTVQQSSTAPDGFANSLAFTVTAADASISSGDYYLISQLIEGYNIADLGFGTASAKTFTISFQVRSSLTGTFGGALRNGANNRFYPFTYTISSANTWQQVSITVAGDTTGTWSTTNTTGFEIIFSLGAGLLGTAGSWSGTAALGATGQTQLISTLSATWYITGVQLEVGSSATGFEYRQYQQELALCQRYYEVGGTSHCWSGYAVNANNYFVTQKFSVTKRATPTLSYTDGGVGSFPAGAPTAYTATTTEAACYKTCNSTGNSGYYFYSWTAAIEL